LVRDFSSWSEPLAHASAADAGIGPRTDAHFKVIQAIRDQYAKLGVAPVMHRICHDAGIELHRVDELFSSCIVAWRASGLPNPGEEAKSYLSSM
jgi:dissimilatory sulfite reductase related protein